MNEGMSSSESQKLENFKTACAGALRAMSRKTDVEPRFSASEPPVGKTDMGKKPSIPLPDHTMSAESVALVRGCADTAALRLAHHDKTLHMAAIRSTFNTPEARAVFDALEQARCEALGANTMDGVAGNLEAVLEERSKRHGFVHVKDRDQSQMADALHMLARMEFTGEAAPPSGEKLVEAWKPWIEEKLGTSLCEYLSSQTHVRDLKTGDEISPSLQSVRDNILKNQEHFADLASQLVRELELLPPEEGDYIDMEEVEGENEEEQNDAPEQQEQNDTGDTQERGMEDVLDDAEAGSFDMGLDDILEDMLEDGEDIEGTSEPVRMRPPTLEEMQGGYYTVYTTAFDEEVQATDLADDWELQRLRDMLDKQLAHHQAIITKLANRLQRKLMAQQLRTWQFDLEEGILDSARLARVVANPNVPLSFKQEKQLHFRDTIVTLLIDNSGSMRGRPIATAAMTTDILAKTLERCGVKVEILGFTTRAWKGGKSRELWAESGAPKNPGRLNDIRHIIYKNADAPMRRTGKNIGLMLKEGILKENIDGEALVWAHNRLSPRKEARKILMVISDGAPVDDSTLSSNPSNMLEADLRNVINWIEERSDIELTAIGIGHDVTRYYKNSICIPDADELASALVEQLGDLFGEG